MYFLSKLIFITFLTFSISACSTIEGIGKDIKKGGQVIEEAAKKATN